MIGRLCRIWAPVQERKQLLTFRFRVIRAWDLEVDELIASGEPGLLPLVPFAGDGSATRTEAAQRLH